MDYDVLVVGSGIGGMESALKLGDMGYKVLVVEKDASVGGKMILLSKVFPTLDCASCISTPKMAATIHHDNITAFTYSEVEGIASQRGREVPRPDSAQGPLRRRGRLHRLPEVRDRLHRRRPRPVQRRHDPPARGLHRVPPGRAEEGRHRSRRQLARARSRARPASRPTDTCRSSARGEYEKAFQLVLEATPLAGTLGRACYAPCETDCTRGELEGTLPIRRLKRFADDWHHEHFDGPGVAVAPPNGRRVAIVGSGPAGLTAAWQLARSGYAVRILEAAPEPGGFLRLAIPAYRLPADVVAKDIKNVTDIGVELDHEQPRAGPRRAAARRVRRGPRGHRNAALHEPRHPWRGAPRRPRRRRVPARRAPGPGDGPGGPTGRRRRWRQRGNGRRADRPTPGRRERHASPTAAAAKRCRPTGPRSTTPSARASSSRCLTAPLEVAADDAGVRRAACAARRWPSAQPDASGRRRPSRSPAASSRSTCEVVIAAIGMAPDTRAFADVASDERERHPARRPDHAPDRGRRHLRCRRRRDRAQRTSPAPSARDGAPRS